MRPIVLAVLLLCTAGAAGAASASADAAGKTAALTTGSQIPADFSVSVSDLSGSMVRLVDRVPPARREAQAALLVFWATWCAPCVQEIPTVKSLNDFYKPKGLAVVAVGLNEGGDTIPLVKAAMNRHGIDYEVLFDAKGEARKAFDMPGIPWSALVDRNGVVRWAGPALPKDASAIIRDLLTPKEDRGAR